MVDIDNVLVSLGIGRYQFTGCVLFGIMLMYSDIQRFMYVFTAGDLKYRCEIPACDGTDAARRIYEPDWLRFTTPYRDDAKLPRKCQRFAAVPDSENGTRCAASGFDENATETCGDRWVFEEPENTVGTEVTAENVVLRSAGVEFKFGLMCEENKWKLTMVGTVNSFGQFIGIPMSGVVADKFGRKFTLIFCAVTSAALCIVQSFSTDYTMFLGLELLSSIISSGIYSITFILAYSHRVWARRFSLSNLITLIPFITYFYGQYTVINDGKMNTDKRILNAMELISPDHRVFYLSLLESFLPLGACVVPLVASQVKDWRLLMQISNIPGLLFFAYFWLIEESMRWLEMRGKHDRVLNVLTKIATTNKKPMPEIQLNTQTKLDGGDETNDVKIDSGIFKATLHSPTIFRRMIRCSSVWIAVALVYYGLTINAADIAGNKYLNFALASIVEIPACLLYWLVTKKMSRKSSLSSMFLATGVTCVLYNATSEELYWIKLPLFLVSKLAISSAFSIVYLLTAEIFPTQLRATMVSMCSMIGRIGSMLAPQTTLLTEFFGGYVMMIVFGGTALLGALITTTLPESKNIKLPDTIDEAERIGIDEDAKLAMVQPIPPIGILNENFEFSGT